MELFFIFLVAVYMFWVFVMTVPMILESLYLLFRTTNYDDEDLDGYVQDSWVVIIVSFVGLISGIYAFGMNPYVLSSTALWYVFISYAITMSFAWIANKKFKDILSEEIANLNYTDEHKSMYCGYLKQDEDLPETERLRNDGDRLQEDLAEKEAPDTGMDEQNAQEETDREVEDTFVSDETKGSDELGAEVEVDENEQVEIIEDRREVKEEDNTELKAEGEGEEKAKTKDSEPVEIVEDRREVEEEDNIELKAEGEAKEEETIILADEEKQEDLEEAEL